MPVTLKLEGVDTFKSELRAFPAVVAEDARRIIRDAAGGALRELRGAYPPRDPKSRSRFMPIGQAMVLVQQDQGPLHPKAWVTHREVLTQWYEKGTPPRVTRRRGQHATGRMPAAPTFVPITVRWQRIMASGLRALLTRAGFMVRDGR